MKKLAILLLIISLLLTTGCKEPIVSPVCENHIDTDSDNLCDTCSVSVAVTIDFYGINDLHGKAVDTDTNEGVDELTTFLKNARATDENVVILSSGDMWQGSSESNMTKGLFITDWMNAVGFDSMTLGNHEFDWGEELIEYNLEIAEFPFLAINIYDKETNSLADYCAPSVIIERGGIKIGIIGAVGDCYSSISADKVEDVYFKTGSELTKLVKAEANALRALGAEYIVYSLHDGNDSSNNYTTDVSANELSAYYDVALSEGYVDLVFEGHTHQRYVMKDREGVYHLQSGGENKGVSHVEVTINYVNDTSAVNEAEFVAQNKYSSLPDDKIIDELVEKYAEQIAKANRTVGINSRYRSSEELRRLVADLYYQAGLLKWGEEYDIVLGGGFISVRNPYELNAGEVKYSDLQSIFPFDNQLVLCSISGKDIISRFFENSNSNYYISYGEYGESVYKNVDPNATYYLITDVYSSSYKWNRLTVVDWYDADVFARDLLSEYIEGGGFSKTGLK